MLVYQRYVRRLPVTLMQTLVRRISHAVTWLIFVFRSRRLWHDSETSDLIIYISVCRFIYNISTCVTCIQHTYFMFVSMEIKSHIYIYIHMASGSTGWEAPGWWGRVKAKVNVSMVHHDISTNEHNEIQ